MDKEQILAEMTRDLTATASVEVYIEKGDEQVELDSLVDEINQRADLCEADKDWLRCEIVRALSAQIEGKLEGERQDLRKDFEGEVHRAGERVLLQAGNQWYYGHVSPYWTGSDYVAKGQVMFGPNAPLPVAFETRAASLSEVMDLVDRI